MKGGVCLMLAVAVVAVGVFFISEYERQIEEEKERSCPPLHTLRNDLKDKHFDRIPFHCFFVTDYEQSRHLFRHAVTQAGGEVVSEPIGYEDLTIDFGVFLPREGTFENLLVHMSGTHGVEAYAGSAAQLAALEFLSSSSLFSSSSSSSSSPSSSTAIVFIHAVNPFGFKYHRRVNENNVDLNRNFLDEEGWKEALSRSDDFAGYASMSSNINPAHPPTRNIFLNDVVFWSQNILNLIQHGLLKIKKAIVAGNYHDPMGIGYGGQESQPSVRVIEKFLSERGFNKVRGGMVLIDVHTGLGPSGVDTMMEGGRSTDQVFQREDDPPIFEDMKGAGDASSGYDQTIGTTNDFCNRFFSVGKPLHVCVTEEFGTLPAPLVGAAQIQEMAAWRFKKSVTSRLEKGISVPQEEIDFSDELMEMYSVRKLSVFFRNSTEWKHSVAKRGLLAFISALDSLERCC